MIDTPLGEEIREGHCGWRSGDRPALVAKPTFSSTTAALHVYFGGSLREIDALTRHEPPSLVVPELLSTAIPVPIVRSRFGGSKSDFCHKKNSVLFRHKIWFSTIYFSIKTLSYSTSKNITLTFIIRAFPWCFWFVLKRSIQRFIHQ